MKVFQGWAIMLRRVLASPLALGLLIIGSQDALAQSGQDATVSLFDRGRNVSVRERSQPALDPLGVPVGAFLLSPSIEANYNYTDNLLATDTDRLGASSAQLGAAATLASRWSRHSVSAGGRVNTVRTPRFENLSYTDYSATLGGTLDIGTRTALSGDVLFGSFNETPDASPVAAILAEPTRFELTQVVVSARHERNRLRLSARGELRSFDFGASSTLDGAVLDQSFRDRLDVNAGGRVEYAITPVLAGLIDVERYSRDFDVGGVANATGVRLLTGVNFDAARLMRGEVSVGRFREDNGVGEVAGIATRASVELFPDELVTVSLNAERETADANVGDAGSRVRTGGSATLDYELRRNIILSCSALFSRENFTGIDRRDERWTARASMDYRVNRVVSLGVSYERQGQTSQGLEAGRSFDINRLLAGVRLRR